MPSITPENFLTASGTVSGQPSSSSKPFLVSGLSTHLSLSSKIPSPSLSRIGQPSGLTPTSFGHRSQGSGTPSLSRSGSGQPFGAGPASRGQKSSLSSTPSVSVSAGQPFGATPCSAGHWSSLSM